MDRSDHMDAMPWHDDDDDLRCSAAVMFSDSGEGSIVWTPWMMHARESRSRAGNRFFKQGGTLRSMDGRNITEGVVILHETSHELHRKKQSGVIFKIDFEKAYDKAKEDGQSVGVVPHLIDEGLTILQYADDILIFMDHDIDKAKNMKLILNVFAQLSGLKINFHKSLMKVKDSFLALGSFMVNNGSQVLFRVTYWLRFWAHLQKHEENK
uniref:Reverse transcriptase domain-containing protein n=1 Tax=Oryza brachyantha TaxID=4533 RepID=J3LHT9_ORYBR